MKKTTYLAVLSLSALMMLGITVPSFAETSGNQAKDIGWKRDTIGWQYLNEYGTPVKNEWHESKGKSFYLGNDGYIEKGTLIHDSDDGKETIAYVNQEGARIKDAWVYANDVYDGSGFKWFYFDSSGEAVRSKGSSKSATFNTINDRDYMFDENGHMLYGWVMKDGTQDLDNPESWKEAEYYLGTESDGSLAKGWRKIAVEDSDNDNNQGYYWFYFDKDGKKVKGPRKTVTGKTYTFDSEDGHMITSWAGDKTSDVNGSDEKINFMTSTGEMVKGKWTYAVPDKNYDEDAYDSGTKSWWYLDNNGRAVKNTIKQINGKKFGFDSIGRMITGFAVKSGSDLAALTNSDTATNDLSPSEFLNGQNTIYYFGEHGAQGVYGVMKTGYVNIELSDGNHQFYFDKNGRGLTGYNSKLKKFLTSGMILKASSDDNDEYHYAGIQVTSDYKIYSGYSTPIYGNELVTATQNGSYVLVNRSGTVMKDKSELKDGDLTYTTDSNGFITKIEKANTK